MKIPNGVFQIETRPHVHRASSTHDQRSLTFTSDKLRDGRINISKRTHWIFLSENEKHSHMFPNTAKSLPCCDRRWTFVRRSSVTTDTWLLALHDGIHLSPYLPASPPPHALFWKRVLDIPPKIQSVRLTTLRLCRSHLYGTLFLLPISVYVSACMSIWRV